MILCSRCSLHPKMYKRSICNECFKDDARKRTNRYNRILSSEEYELLFKQQGGVCAICQKPETRNRDGRPYALVEDHCHKRNKVRGLLCGKCNTGLGMFNDNLSLLYDAMGYLIEHGDI